jgi:uncharacterized protein
MDYANRERLKIIGRARVTDARENPALAAALRSGVAAGVAVERILEIDVIGYDWNCPKFITPRFTAAEIATAIEPLKQRIAELEATLKAGTAGPSGS